MKASKNYIEINKTSWNKRTAYHVQSDFYKMDTFKQGATSLDQIALEQLGDIQDKSILHLQCHFGQDSLSMSRMGAAVTGVDLSDKSIEQAQELSKELALDARFICCDIYELPKYLDQQFDMVFTSYGTIGWLPDLDKWADIVRQFLKPGGQFCFIEFHPVVWMFDDDFKTIHYNYFNSGPIVETESGTYADKEANLVNEYVMWNHSMSEVVQALISKGLRIQELKEFDYSPYNCFSNTVEFEAGKYRIEHLGSKIPMVYAINATLESV